MKDIVRLAWDSVWLLGDEIRAKCGFGRKCTSGFSASSTAEEVTEGIDGTGLTAIVTGLPISILMDVYAHFQWRFVISWGRTLCIPASVTTSRFHRYTLFLHRVRYTLFLHRFGYRSPISTVPLFNFICSRKKKKD